MTQKKTIVLALAGLVLTPSLSLAQTHNSNTIGLALMNLNAATLKGTNYTLGDIWGRMRRDFRIGEVNPELVRRHEQYYAARSAYFNRTVQRSQPYLYHIVAEVEKRQMPAEIALLPFIESAFVTKAKSPVGASGLWQFMPASGRQYGLEQTTLYDGRHDVYAATDAALNYLQYLYGLFGDWSLALAAYNWGEGSVGRAVARAQAQGLEPVYENLRMPNETRNYVPKLLAVRNLINNPQAFGLDLAKIDNKPYFGVVSVDQPLDIQAAVRLANVSEDEFLKLNPSFKTPVFMPKANRKMLLPLAAVSAFERNYRAANKADLLSWDIYTAQSSTSLSDLAMQTGMSVSEIKHLNKLSSNNLAAGRSLLLAKNALNPGMTTFGDRDDADPLLAAAMAQPVMQPVLKPAVAAPVLAAAQTANAVDTLPITVAQPEAVPANINLAAFDGTNNARTPAAAIVAQVDSQPAPVATNAASTLPITVAEPEPVTLAAGPTNINVTGTTTNTVLADATSPTGTENASMDPLLDLVHNSAQRESNVREVVRDALAKAEAEEARRQTQLAAAENTRAKAQLQARAKADPTIHRVQSGDTLFSIAQRYKLNVADLVSANQLKGSNIRQGQVLQVALNKTGQAGLTKASGKGSKKAPTLPASYTVKKGDTLNAIAARFNVPLTQLQKLNKTGSGLRPGQKIKLTGV